jgi:parvulin-like peptidyl-prolyl isomerase
VRSIFGKGFADSLLASGPSVWSGPFPSGYGTHLVRLESKTVTGVLDLIENRNRARNLIKTEREEGLIQNIVTELGGKYYSVLIDGVPADSFRLEQLLDT